MRGGRLNKGIAVLLAVGACALAPSLAAGDAGRTRCFTPPAVGPLTAATLKQMQTCLTGMATTARSRVASIASAVEQCALTADRSKVADSIQRFGNTVASIKQGNRVTMAYLQDERVYYQGLGRSRVANRLATLSQKMSQLVSTLYAMYLSRGPIAASIDSGQCAKAQSKLAALQQKAQTAKIQLEGLDSAIAALE